MDARIDILIIARDTLIAGLVIAAGIGAFLGLVIGRLSKKTEIQYAQPPRYQGLPVEPATKGEDWVEFDEETLAHQDFDYVVLNGYFQIATHRTTGIKYIVVPSLGTIILPDPENYDWEDNDES